MVIVLFYIAAPLGHQATSIITQYLTQSRYPDTELNSPSAILLLLNEG